MSEVDTNQDPNEFANMANNPEPADPNGQPTVPDPGGDKPPAEPQDKPPEPTPDKPAETPAGDAPPAPTGDKPPEIKPEEPPVPADPNGQPTEQKTPEDLEKERVSASQKIQELGEERSKMFKTYVGIVEDNPEVIKDIYKKDPELANAVVKEQWGYDTYDELMAHARVKELEETDPERAKSEKELLEVKSSNKKILTQLKTNAESTFYTGKGIQNNPYDPSYKAVQVALKKVSPDLIESNYAEALEIAHSIAFPGKTTEQIEADKKQIALATGSSTPQAPGAGAPPAAPSKHTPAQQGFMQNVGVTPT